MEGLQLQVAPVCAGRVGPVCAGRDGPCQQGSEEQQDERKTIHAVHGFASLGGGSR